jgi:dTDP-4-amino-4,6-dideoxygalactose transaminase
MPVAVRKMFEDYCIESMRVKDAIAVNSGTSSLIASLWSMDLKPDDEVITTPLTFIATSNAILIAGAKPVFVDINKDDYLIDVNKIEDAITDKTRAIIPVHLYGRVCDMNRIIEIANRHNLIVIEDTAQAFGQTYNDQLAGTMGDAGCFSFYKTKNISTFEGGMITVNQNSKLDADKIRSITDQGQVGKYVHEYIGFNFRLAEPLCLMALEQMKFHMTGIRAELGLRGPEQGHYPKLVYDQPCYQRLNITGNCPVAKKVAEEISNNKL